MKRIVIALAASGMFALAGAAHADSTTTGKPGNGNQGCTLSSGDHYKNPGKMFQAIRDGTADTTANPGNNPKDTVNQFPSSFDTVGDLIAQKCGVAPD